MTTSPLTSLAHPGPPARPAGSALTVRVMAAGALLLALAVFGFLLSFLSGAGGQVGGWAWATLLFAPAALLAPLPIRRVLPYRRVATGLLGLALLAGLGQSASAILSEGRLRQVAGQVGLPEQSWQRVGQATSGNNLCFDTCTTWRVAYTVPSADAQSTLGGLANRFAAHGCEPGRPYPNGTYTEVGGYRTDPGTPTVREQFRCSRALATVTVAQSPGHHEAQIEWTSRH